MSQKSISKKRKYHYRYIQVIVSLKEKEKIEEFRKKENFKTLSDFVRRIIFDHIRKRENPDLFMLADDSTLNSIVIERIAQNTGEIRELISQRLDSLEEIRKMVANLHRIAEVNALAKERETIMDLLENHSSLSLRQIQEETNLPEDIIFKIISDLNLFKITASGRFALR